MIPYVAFCVLICTVAGMQGTVASSGNLQVTFATNPTIVAPGTNGYLEVLLESVGSGTIENIELTPSSWDSLVILPQGNWDVYVGDLDGGDSISVLYEFKVSSSAKPGLYQIVYDIEYMPGADIRQTAIIQVEDTISLDVVSVTPSSINIGEVTTVVFNVTNNGGSSVENILFTWDDANDLILPIGSDNRTTIDAIPAGNYTEIPIFLMVSPSISPGVYPITLTMEYYDKTGTQQTFISEIGLQICGTTDFEVVLQQSTTSGTTFAVANTGANVASSVIVSIPQQMNYVASGTSSVSLGNLDAGDYTLASFQLSSSSVDRNTSKRPFGDRDLGDMPTDFDPSMFEEFGNRSFGGIGGNTLTVEISYTDLFGVRQTVEKEVEVSSISSSGVSGDFASRGGMSGFPGQSVESNDGTVYIVIGAVGIIVIVAILKIGKSKKLLKLITKGKNK